MENNLILVQFQHVGAYSLVLASGSVLCWCCYKILCWKWFLFLVLVAVQKLATTGAKMVIISNSSRRASTTMEKMKSLGFDTSLFLGAITSGELTHQYLQRLVIQLYGVEELCSMFGVVLVIEKTVAFLCLYGSNFVYWIFMYFH